MVQLLRNNTPYAVLLLLVFAILILAAPLPAVFPEASMRVPVYHAVVLGIRKLAGQSQAGWMVLHLVLVFLQSLYLNSLVLRNRLLPKATFTPAFLYLIFAAALPDFRGVPQALVANFFLLGALDAMLQFGHPTQPRRQIFNAGFLIGAAAFVQFSYIFGFLLLLMALVLLRPFHPGEYVSALIGFLVPIYFAAGLLFLFDALPALRLWPQLGFSLPVRSLPLLQYSLLIGISAALVVAGLYLLQKLMNRSTIYIRRAWGVVISGGLVAIVIALSATPSARGSWLAVAPFFALATAPVLENEKPSWFATFAFWLLIAVAILCRLHLHP